MSGGDKQCDFFISYTNADAAWAQWIADVVEREGYTVVLQARDFLSGGNFVLEMDAAVTCERTIAVISPAYFESDYAKAEWAAAFREDPAGEKSKLIPVRIANFAPEGLLGSVVYIDLVGLSEEEARRKVVDEITAIQAGRRIPEGDAPFPGVPQGSEELLFPAGLPSAWNLPLRLRHFFGRTGLLTSIQERLFDHRICVLTGLGGVGKSRTALEYAHLHATEHDIVWRIRADEKSSARADLAELARSIGIAGVAEMSLADQAEAALRSLAREGRWLLVLEDAASTDAARDLIPGGSAGKILITTRRASGWSTLGEAIEVAPLTEGEAVDFIRGRVEGASTEEAGELARALGSLPLALEQSSAYMEATGIGPGEYVGRLREHSPTLFASGAPLDYGLTVASTWRLAMTEIANDEGAATLLHLLPTLSPERIPRGLFDGSDPRFAVTPTLDRVALDAAIAELRRFSLVGIGAGELSIHRLVQWAVRQAQTESVRAETWDKVDAILVEAWPDWDGRAVEEWPACGALAVHLEAHAQSGIEEKRDPGRVAELLGSAAVYLRARGELGAARSLLLEARALCEHESVGAEQRIVVLGELGVVLTILGDYAGALEAQESAAALLEEEGLDDSTIAGQTYGFLGIALLENGELIRAEEMHEKAVAFFRRQTPVDSHQLGAALGNLGNVVRRAGDLVRATELQEESVGLMEAAHGPRGSEVATSLAGLARVRRAGDDLPGAREALTRALEIFRSTYGPESLEVAAAQVDLGAINGELGRLGESVEGFEVAISVYRAKLGPDVPMLRPAFEGLAMSRAALGDTAGAARASAEARRLG